MKKILIIPFLILLNNLQAQEQVSIAVYQDAKLLFAGDKQHGYDAGTLDLLLRIKMQGNQQKYGFLVVFPEFEYAEIQGIYKRWSANVGYTFNQLILKNLEASSYIGWGWADRGGLTFSSFSLNAEMGYKVSKRFKVLLNAQFVQRKDLQYYYNDDNVIRFSGFIGLEIKIL